MSLETHSGESPQDFSDGLPPPHVPDHRVFQCIGVGAYGKVWMASNAMGEWRAVKAVYERSFGKDSRSYDREFIGIQSYAAVSLKHNSLLPILHVGRDEKAGCFFYIMELADHLDGSRPTKAEGYEPKSLRRVLGVGQDRRPLPWKDCIAIGSDLAEALDRLHKERLVHRDVKPANIIFVHGRPKLADLGLVTEFDATRSDVGTLMYLTPETAGKPEGDRYALGKVLYEMVTGREVSSFPALPPLEGMERLEHQRLLDLNDIFTKACSCDPFNCYKDTAELVNELLLLKAGESLAEQRRIRRWLQLSRRYGIGVMLLALATLALLNMHLKRAEQIRGTELLQAELLLGRLREAGWTTNYEAHMQRARKVRTGRDLWDSAAAAMGGMELIPVQQLPRIEGSSVAFGKNGQVLFGGLRDSPAHMLPTKEDRIESLKERGDGPVGFDAQDVPIHFVSTGEGHFVLREVNTGRVRRLFPLAGEPVTGHDERPALALATNCSRVAAAVRLGEGRGCWAVWDSLSGKVVATTNELVRAMAFSPDATCLATGDKDGNVMVRTLPGLEEVFKVQVAQSEINCLAFGPDLADACSGEPHANSWLLAVGDNAAAITICETASRKIRTRCLGSTYYINSLAFSPDGTTLASTGYPGMRIWDVSTGQPLLIMEDSWSNDICYGRGLAYSPDGHSLAVASENRFCKGSVNIFAIQDNRGVRTLRGLGSRVDRIWWSSDAHQLAALAHNWDLGIWDASSGVLTHIVRTSSGESADNAAVVFFPDHRRFAFAAGSKAFLYDLVERQFIKRWDIPSGYSDSLRFEGGKLLHLHSEVAVGRPRRMWALRDLLGEDPLTPILEQQDTNWVAWETLLLGEGYFLIKGGPRDTNVSGSAIQAWRTNGAHPQWVVESKGNYNSCWWAPDTAGKHLMYLPATSSNLAQVLSLPSGRFLFWVDRIGTISPSGEEFAEGGNILWGKNRGGKTVTLGAGLGQCGVPEFSPEGSRLAWPVANGCVMVANLAEVQDRLRKLGWKPR